MDKKVVYSSIFTSNHNTDELDAKAADVVYSSIFTSNHNYKRVQNIASMVVYSSIFTSNHNDNAPLLTLFRVVYSSIFTSNHNRRFQFYIHSLLYILLSLHQTTTPLPITKTTMCCIFFYLYIKPQPRCDGIYITISCIFFYLYIKPQPPGSISVSESVVYSSIFTSNHNDFVMILIQD